MAHCKKELPKLEEYEKRIADCLPKNDQAGRAKVLKAMAFGYELHREQRRKSGEPYIDHPVAVLNILAHEFNVHVPDILTAALLHDVVEDVDSVTLKDIAREFGPTVAELVDGCTKLRHSNADKKHLKELTHDKIFFQSGRNIGVLTIKLADRLHNLRTLHHLRPTKRQRIARETIDFYAPLTTALNMFPLKREMYELAIIHFYSKKCKKILKHIRMVENSAEARQLLDDIRERVGVVYPDCEVRFRAKNISNYYDPITERLDINQSRDIADFTIVLDADSMIDCYNVLGIINTGFKVVPRTMRDFITNEKPNGYRSLHVRIKVDEANSSSNYLVKIRTTEMDNWANFGMFSHWKEDHPFSDEHWKEVSTLLESAARYAGTSSDKAALLHTSEAEDIFAYTPDGDIYYLPEGSTVLDFAFKVHTGLGERCSHAIVDGLRVPLTHVLSEGATVRIVSSNQPFDPSPRLEQACRSHRAKSHLARMMKYKRRGYAAIMGEQIMAQVFAEAGLPVDCLRGQLLEQILDILNIKSLHTLHSLVGRHKLKSKLVLYYVNDLYAGERVRMVDIPGASDSPQYTLTMGEVLPGIHKLSNCCNPFPGADGLVSGLSKRGVALHRADCESLAELNPYDKGIYAVRWDQEAKWKSAVRYRLVVNGYRFRADVFAVLGTLGDGGEVRAVDFIQSGAGEQCEMDIIFKGISQCGDFARAFEGMRLAVADFYELEA